MDLQAPSQEKRDSQAKSDKILLSIIFLAIVANVWILLLGWMQFSGSFWFNDTSQETLLLRLNFSTLGAMFITFSGCFLQNPRNQKFFGVALMIGGIAFLGYGRYLAYNVSQMQTFYTAPQINTSTESS